MRSFWTSEKGDIEAAGSIDSLPPAIPSEVGMMVDPGVPQRAASSSLSTTRHPPNFLVFSALLAMAAAGASAMTHGR